MKLSAEELDRIDALVSGLPVKGARAVPGMPGCRAQPLSCNMLIARREAALKGHS